MKATVSKSVLIFYWKLNGHFQNQVHEYLKSGSRILTKDSKGVKVEERSKPLFFHLDDRMKPEITKACEFHNKKVEHF